MTELEILYSAWHYEIMLWSNEERRMAISPYDYLIRRRVEFHWNNQEELHERILKLENEKKSV